MEVYITVANAETSPKAYMVAKRDHFGGPKEVRWQG